MFENGVETKTLYFSIETIFTKILQTLKSTVGVRLDIENTLLKPNKILTVVYCYPKY